MTVELRVERDVWRYSEDVMVPGSRLRWTATFTVTPEQAYHLAGGAMPEIGAHTQLPESIAQRAPAGRWRITGVASDLASNTCRVETVLEPPPPSWTLTAEAVDGAPDA